MDGAHFDRLTRSLSTRRTALGGLLGGVAALLGVSMPDEAAAHNPTAACRRLANSAARRRCLRRAASHRQRCHSAQTVAAACAAGCGVRPDRCGNAVSCPCRADKACLSNGSCSRACRVAASGIFVPCPEGCTCGLPPAETPGVSHCYSDPPITDCSQIPVPCMSTAGCPAGFFCHAGSCGGRCVPVCHL